MSAQAKVHIHLTVSDLEKSKEFYARFFGAAPVKEKPGYAKFLPEIGPINLALSEGRSVAGAGAANHLGIQVASPEILRSELTRVKATRLPVREEMNHTCCYANQDKFWVLDPDGVEWEIYHLNYDTEEREEKAPVACACC